MRSSKILITLSILLLLSCNSQHKDEENLQALTHATVYDGKGNQLKNTTVLIKDNRIVDLISDTDKIPENAEIIDLSGKFITPGLVDAHVHFFQTAFFDARPDALNIKDSLPYEETYNYQMQNPERYYEAYLRSGITAVYDVGDFNATFAFAKASEENLYAPHIATAGPLLTPFPEESIGSFNTQEDTVMISLTSPEVGVHHVNRVLKRGATGIKIWSLAPEDTTFMKSLEAVSQEVERQDNQLIVHATTLKQAKAALKLGARLLVHSVEDTLVDQEFISLATENNTFYNPTLTVSRGYFNTYNAVLGDKFKLEDPNNAVDAKTKELLQGAESFKRFISDTLQMRKQMQGFNQRLTLGDSIMARNLKKVYDAGIPIVVGTDAGNPGTVHGISIYNELEAMQDAGIPASELIKMATYNGAQAMRRSADFGSIEKGKIADLIILQEDPGTDINNMRTITHFMRAGNLQPVEKPFD